MILVLLACAPAPVADAPVDSGDPVLVLPGHNDCLPEGQEMSDEICAAVVEEDGRLPTVPTRAAGTDDPDDPRLEDPDYQWLTGEVKRCTCVCCHSTRIGGPGAHRWDIDFQPMWLDSMNDWSMSVFVGDTDEIEQTLPTDDPERLRAVIEAERALRESQRP